MNKLAYHLGRKLVESKLEKVARYANFATGFTEELRKTNPELIDTYLDSSDYPKFDVKNPEAWGQFVKNIKPHHDAYYKKALERRIAQEMYKDLVDIYWYWLKAHGAMDFIKDFVRYKEEPGYIIGENRGNISIPRLDEWTLQTVVGALSRNI